MLDAMHAVPVQGQAPSTPISIIEARVIRNPFREAIALILRKETKLALSSVTGELDRLKHQERRAERLTEPDGFNRFKRDREICMKRPLLMGE